MYRKHGPEHVVLVTSVWPIIPIDDPDFQEWVALGNAPEDQGDEQPRNPLTMEQVEDVLDLLLTSAPEPEVFRTPAADENALMRDERDAALTRVAELEAENAELKSRPPVTVEVEKTVFVQAPLPDVPIPEASTHLIPDEISALMEEGETLTAARKRLTELLNVEKAELRLKRNAGSATEADLKREGDVDRLQSLFSRLGEI